MSKKEKPSTKLCKHCKTEIPYDAKVCPNCRKKQGMGLVMKIVVAILALGIIGAIFGGGSEEPVKEFQKDYAQSDVVVFNDVTYSITNVEKTQGSNEFVLPAEGKEYVKVTVKIENTSENKISYNALDWQMVNADGVEDAYGTFTADDDVMLNSGELDAGGKVEGVLVWEQKIGDNNLRLRFYENALFDDEYTFQFKLD